MLCKSQGSPYLQSRELLYRSDSHSHKTQRGMDISHKASPEKSEWGAVDSSV